MRSCVEWRAVEFQSADGQLAAIAKGHAEGFWPAGATDKSDWAGAAGEGMRSKKQGKYSQPTGFRHGAAKLANRARFWQPEL